MTTMTAPASHLDLLRAARAVQRAAVEDDLDAINLQVSRLRNALIEHLHTEGCTLTHLSDKAQQVVRQGQQRLLELVDVLLFTTLDGSDCSCLVRAAELHSAVARQAHLEASLVRASPPGTR